MKLCKAKFFFIALLCFLKSTPVLCRSVHRTTHKKKPLLQARWASKPSKCYYLREWLLKKDPIFASFDKVFFHTHMLPDTITYRYDEDKQVTKQELANKIEHLLTEIDQKKRRFTHFIILKKTDFKRRKKCGIMVLKYKDYPFVLKIFMETPRSFTSPYSKGFCPFFIHGISGGINRHLLGFTRIKNLKHIRKIVASAPHWSTHIALPRKWFWVPKDCKEIELVGKNFPGQKKLKTIIPSTYCIIADMLQIEDKAFSLFDKKARKTSMALCNFLDMRIDPYVGNFFLEKGTSKIAIIDTEHFPSYIGSKKYKRFSGYFSEYWTLSAKYVHEMFFRPKEERLCSA